MTYVRKSNPESEYKSYSAGFKHGFPDTCSRTFESIALQWRVDHRLLSEDNAKRELIMRALAVFPPSLYCLTLAEFTAKAVEFTRTGDTTKILLCLVTENLACLGSNKGELIETGAARAMIGKTYQRATLWLTAKGVKIWAEQCVDRQRQSVQGCVKISAELTEKLVGLNYGLKPRPSSKSKTKNEVTKSNERAVQEKVSQADKTAVSDAARPEGQLPVRRDGEHSSGETSRSDEVGENSRVEEDRAVLAPVSPAPYSSSERSIRNP